MSSTRQKESLAAHVSPDQTPLYAVADPGFDDILALSYLLDRCPERLKGIVASGGNVGVDRTLRNTLYLLEKARIHHVSVYKGSPVPMGLKAPAYTAEKAHGDSGMGRFVGFDHVKDFLEESKTWETRTVVEEDAMVRLAEEIEGSPQPVDLISTGPLTDVAKLLLHLINCSSGTAEAIDEGQIIRGEKITLSDTVKQCLKKKLRHVFLLGGVLGDTRESFMAQNLDFHVPEECYPTPENPYSGHANAPATVGRPKRRSEFNFYYDRIATDFVLDILQQAGISTFLIPLNVTHTVLMGHREASAIKENISPKDNPMAHYVSAVMGHHPEEDRVELPEWCAFFFGHDEKGRARMAPHDLLMAMLAVHPELFEGERGIFSFEREEGSLGFELDEDSPFFRASLPHEHRDHVRDLFVQAMRGFF